MTMHLCINGRKMCHECHNEACPGAFLSVKAGGSMLPAASYLMSVKDLHARCRYYQHAIELQAFMVMDKEMNFITMAAFRGDTIPTSRLVELRRELTRLIDSRMHRAINGCEDVD